MTARPALESLAQGWAERARADLEIAAGQPLLWMAGVTRKSCAWELMRLLNAMEKENPLEGGPLPPHDADRESA